MGLLVSLWLMAQVVSECKETERRKKRLGMSEKKKGYKNLLVWQKAKDLALQIYSVSKDFPNSENFGLTSQLRRAAVSIPANIAEGCERQHDKEFIQFLYISRGSVAEVEVFIDIAFDLGYLSKESFQTLEAQACEVGKLINGLIKSLK